jgi:hypothetical protein
LYHQGGKTRKGFFRGEGGKSGLSAGRGGVKRREKAGFFFSVIRVFGVRRNFFSPAFVVAPRHPWREKFVVLLW